MAYGLCVFDEDLRIVTRNRHFLEMYDLRREDAQPGTSLLNIMRLLIARGMHTSEATPEEMLADFHERLIDNKEPVLHRRMVDGRLIAVRHQPMAGGGWVGTYEDITDRERTADAIREQNLCFDAALNNMSEGLCMLDHALRVIVCNRRYIEMYGLSPQVVKPGVTMDEIMEHSVALGNHPIISAEDLYNGYVERLRSNPDSPPSDRWTDH